MDSTSIGGALRGGARVTPFVPSPSVVPGADDPAGLARNRDGRTAIDRAAERAGHDDPRPDPEWQPRTAPSKTKGGPWVTHFRVWKPGVYEKEGLVSEPRIDLRFKDFHEHWYQVPHQVLAAFLRDTTGGFVHRVLLGKGWTSQNRQSRYPNGPLN